MTFTGRFSAFDFHPRRATLSCPASLVYPNPPTEMFKRIGNLIRGFFGLFVSGLEMQNPEALLEVEKENLRKQIS